MRGMLWMMGGIKNMQLDATIRRSLLDFVKMSAGAYGHSTLQDSLFGFSSTDGLGARIYGYEDKIVIAFKGATLSVLGYPFGPSAASDKRLVNLLFSCCKSEKCMHHKKEILRNHSYFRDARLLLRQVTSLFPERNIVLTGHSMGGVIASVVASTNGLPATVFSTPGDMHLLSSLGLSEIENKITHIGSCDDPIYIGECSTPLSICNLLDYHIRTSCHSGRAYCVESKTPQGILSHRIEILEEILKRAEVMSGFQEYGCHDCLHSYET